MPTAIDELRYEKNSINFTTLLTERWPTLTDPKNQLMSYGLMDSDIDKFDIQKPRNVKFEDRSFVLKEYVSPENIQDYVNAALHSLEKNIVEQLANRDHLLVWLTDGLIVIEPYSPEDGRIHRGLAKELIYIRKVSMNKQVPRRIFAIFTKNSVEKIISSSDFENGFKEQLTLILAKEYGLDSFDIAPYMDAYGNISHETGSLGPISIPTYKYTNIQKNLERHKKHTRIRQFVQMTMNQTENELKYITVHILENLRTF